MTIVALDVDLRKIYCVSDTKQIIAKAEPDPAVLISGFRDGLDIMDTILIEVASPVMYHPGAGAVYNALRWALWNITTAQRVSDDAPCSVLVAPSHVWTRGHPLKMRHEVAGCTLKQKDLRECEAMIFYYKANPSAWKPLAEYLSEL